MIFNKKQIKFMNRIGISINFSDMISDVDYLYIEEKVSEYLQIHGFDNKYEPTEEGKICESILDLL